MKNLLLTIALLFLVCPSAMAEGRFVRQVVDGQTLKLLEGGHVRLIGINILPEKLAEASEFVRSLVSGSVVALEYDVEKTDAEGNLLAYVWFRFEPRVKDDAMIFPKDFDVHYVVDDEGDGEFYVLLNTTIVKAGYATPLETLPNGRYAQLIKKLYEERPIETAKMEVDVQAMGQILPR